MSTKKFSDCQGPACVVIEHGQCVCNKSNFSHLSTVGAQSSVAIEAIAIEAIVGFGLSLGRPLAVKISSVAVAQSSIVVGLSLTLAQIMGETSDDRDVDGLAALGDLGVGLLLLSGEVRGHSSGGGGDDESCGLGLPM